MKHLFAIDGFQVLMTLFCTVTILGASIAYNIHSGIFFSSEAVKYLAHYLGPKPFLAKIYDFRGNDSLAGNTVRTRDLGNAVNYFDAELVLLSLRFNIPGLISYVHYLAIALITLFHMYFTRKYFGKSGFLLSFLFLLVFLTSPGIFLTGIYIRATKTVLSLLFVLSFWILVGAAMKKLHLTPAYLVLLFVLGLSMPLTEEIGYAFLTGFLLLSLLLSSAVTVQPLRNAAIAFGLALVVSVVYRYQISPQIVFMVTGIHPRIWEGKIWLDSYGSLPRMVDAAVTFLDYMRMFLGNIQRGVALALYMFSLFILVRINPRQYFKSGPFRWLFWVFVFLCITGMCIGTIYVMAVTHPAITDMPSKLRYYVIPFHTLLFCFYTLFVHFLARKVRTAGLYCTVFLASAAFLNIISLPGYFSLLKSYEYPQRLENAREITDPVLRKQNITIVYPNTHLQRLETIGIIRKRLGIRAL